MLPFTLQAASGCATHADLALSLAAEFSDVSTEAAHAELDTLAATLGDARHAMPREQLVACAEVVGDRLLPSERRPALDDLLLHRTLERGVGHPLTLAITAVEAGRRAGIPLGLVGGRGPLHLAHAGLPEPLVADLAAPGQLIDLAGREQEVGWQCSHQVAARLLNRIVAWAERIGHVACAIRAAELRLALPLDANARERMQHELERVRVVLN